MLHNFRLDILLQVARHAEPDMASEWGINGDYGIRGMWDAVQPVLPPVTPTTQSIPTVAVNPPLPISTSQPTATHPPTSTTVPSITDIPVAAQSQPDTKPTVKPPPPKKKVLPPGNSINPTSTPKLQPLVAPSLEEADDAQIRELVSEKPWGGEVLNVKLDEQTVRWLTAGTFCRILTAKGVLAWLNDEAINAWVAVLNTLPHYSEGPVHCVTTWFWFKLYLQGYNIGEIWQYVVCKRNV